MNKLKMLIFRLIAIIILLIVIVGIWYLTSTKAVSNKNQEEIEVTIPLGSGTSQIANILKENKLIKSKLAFRIYVKLNNINDFQAGTYYLKQNMNLKEIMDMLKTGIMYDPNQINITFLEGKNIRSIAKTIAGHTNNKEDEVIELLNDEEYLNSLIEKYWFLDEIIKDDRIYYSLEGYLFPDTYAIENENTTTKEILEKMLDQMEKILEEYKDEIENSKYSVHQILTIASIIEMESVNNEDKKDVSSVIYNRLNYGMSLGSDVTTYYAAMVDVGERDLYQKELDSENPYNTRGPNMEGKLPIGPISTVGKASIEAALRPNDTDYLYFVADKNGKVYFTKNSTEHNNIIYKLQQEGLWYEY